MSGLAACKIFAAVVVMAFLFQRNASANPPTSEVRAMSSVAEQAGSLLQLPSDAYFDISGERLGELRSGLARIAGGTPTPASTPAQPLLALGAPREVAEGRKETIHVLVGLVQSGLRAWQVNFRTNLWLILRNLSTGELAVVTPFNDMRRGDSPLLSGVGTPPTGIRAGTTIAAVYPIDLRERLERPVEPGRYTVTAVIQDLRSGSLPMSVGGEARVPLLASLSPQPYLVLGDGPSVHPSTALTVPAAAATGAPIMIELARRVGDGDGVLGTETEHPVWPCHIVLMQPDKTPIVVRAFVPVMPVAAGALQFDAAVRIDLGAALTQPLFGHYVVYIDVGRELLGPYPLKIGD